MSRLTSSSFDWCPDDAAREREANLPRELDEDSVRPVYVHRAVSWAQLQAAINGELQCSECAVRVVADIEAPFMCPICETQS